MLENQPTDLLVGTSQHDQLEGSGASDLIIGLAGDDRVSGGAGDDVIHGDFVAENLLSGTANALSFDQYGASGDWVLGADAAGHAQMSQTVVTMEGATYEVAFELAANPASGAVSGRVEVLWNDAVIGQVDTSSGVFADAALSFTGTGEAGTLTFRALPGAPGDGPEINTDGPVFYYDKTVENGGQEVTVKAFAEGQANIYQVLNGELNVFDPETESYTQAGAEATVVVNAIGFNQEDDLIYGIAVKDGVDALGTPVSQTDLVMYDALGHAYRVGETPHRSWTGDFDGNGNLWAFESDLDRITKIDVDQKDADGNPLATTYTFPSGMVTDKLWDVAYDAASQSFFGLVRPDSEGAASRLIQIDISGVEAGGTPQVSSIPVTGTLVDGVMLAGLPAITFGAFVIDGDGNLYAGGNGGDHDMNDATGSRGGIYRIHRTETGEAHLELVTAAPKSYSNDGAVDPRAMDPFSAFDPAAVVLIRGPELTAVENPAESYDDALSGGAGRDVIGGGYGSDLVTGGSNGDRIDGDDGADRLYGGAGPDAAPAPVSVYDENGLRYDPFGNLLPEDDDVISGGAGDDFLHGSAGHDTLSGDEGNDTLDGGTGHDVLSGGAGNDVLSGGREDDRLHGDDGEDTLEGGSGDDWLEGGAGDDVLSGGKDQDNLFGGAGDDMLNGGSQDDLLDGGAGADALTGGSGDDVLQGGADADVLNGGSGADWLDGGDGNDNLKGGTQNDTLFGGEGRDKLNGGSHDDLLDGGAGKDYLNGYTGDDILKGGDGNDKLVGGMGADVLSGGAGSDVFVFNTGDLDGQVNTITDFSRQNGEADVLDLRDLNLQAQSDDVYAWVMANLANGPDGTVTLDLGADTTIRFLAGSDHEGVQDELRSDIIDGLWF